MDGGPPRGSHPPARPLGLARLPGQPLHHRLRDAEVSAVDLGLQKLAAAGITIVVASGDGGSGCEPPHFVAPPCNSTSPGVVGLLLTGERLAHCNMVWGPGEPRSPLICCKLAGKAGVENDGFVVISALMLCLALSISLPLSPPRSLVLSVLRSLCMCACVTNHQCLHSRLAENVLH